MQNLTRTLALEYARPRHPRQRRRPRRHDHPDQPRLGRRPRQDGDRLEPHPAGPRRHGGRDGRRVRVPGLRRRRLHHRADDLRRRRPDPLRGLPRAVVVRVSDERQPPGGRRRSVATTSSACSTTSPTRRARERCGSCARGGCTTWGGCSTSDAPVFPGRYFRQTLVTTAHHANGGGLGANRVNWITEQIAGTQQLGTHLDALSHLQIGDRGYNGWSVAELAGTAGAKRLGVETVPADRDPRLARGRRRRSIPGEVIGVAGHRSGAGRRGAVPHRLGRALVRRRHLPVRRARPGHGARRMAGGAGRGAHRLRHLELRPAPGRGSRTGRSRSHSSSTPATACSSSRTSTPSALARDGVREFALILTHPKLRGATGAWTSPIALV